MRSKQPLVRHEKAQHSASEEGSTIILIIFGAMLALVLVVGVTAATSLYLERKRLFTLADGAALAASESFEVSTMTFESRIPGSLGESRSQIRPELTTVEVTQAAARYVAATAPNGNHDVTVTRSVTEDGRSATVELTSLWRPPVVSLFFPEGIQINVESTARSIFF